MKTSQKAPKGNYAFIDAQNLNSGLHKLGWKIDWKRFRQYLSDEHNVEVAYVFFGFIVGNQDLYLVLQRAGFVVVFKEILTVQSGEVKGNIDAELILQAMIDYDRYDKALIVSGDGDFTCLLRYLDQNGKFEGLIAPYEKSLSSLIAKAADGKIEHLRSLRRKVEYKYSHELTPKKEPRPPVQSPAIPSVPPAKQAPTSKTPPQRRVPNNRPPVQSPTVPKVGPSPKKPFSPAPKRRNPNPVRQPQKIILPRNKG
ncbi:MAG: NYN domain-containing protein, partial [Candidatus Gracilibacteria bacterium]|nr:NYN domain-containing protein [Candidatus Gracilibacteria bacterium]